MQRYVKNGTGPEACGLSHKKIEQRLANFEDSQDDLALLMSDTVGLGSLKKSVSTSDWQRLTSRKHSQHHVAKNCPLNVPRVKVSSSLS